MEEIERFSSLAEIDTIGACPHPVLRNLRITQAYYLVGIDPTPNALWESDTDDWAVLPDRMHYIADLFRLHLENARLLEQPFSRGQLRSIANDRIPDGPL